MEERIRAIEEGGGGSSQAGGRRQRCLLRGASWSPRPTWNKLPAVFLRAGGAPLALQGPELRLHFSAWPAGSAEARKEYVRRVMASRKKWVPLASAREDGAEVQVIVAGDHSIAQRRREYHLRQLALAAVEDLA